MKRTYWYLIGAVAALITAIVLLISLLPLRNSPPVTEQIGTFSTATTTVTKQPVTTVTNATEPTTAPYVSPIPFEKLQAENPDIYAWIRVPGTSIDYPIVQHPTNDAFYLDHDSDGNFHPNGAIFTERAYNTTDFTDPVTVLYGHDMMSGAMFGELQSLYWDTEFLLENDEIVIYLPDREIHFEIFAALPFSRMHLLYYYHTEKESGFNLLFDDVYSTRKLSAVLLEDRRPTFGDQVVVLSTCMSGDNRYRYLVMGVCKNADNM